MSFSLFGTDGIRGQANRFPIDPQSILKIALALGTIYRTGTHKHRVVIAKDTRLSGYMLENALTSGFLAMGFDVILVGPLPTPAVSMLIGSFRADIGLMISASHNIYLDNGIKVFGADGQKLTDEQQEKIEHLFFHEEFAKPVPSDQIGKAQRYEDAPGRYIEFLKNTLAPGLSFEGMKIVVDCANGAGYRIAPQVLSELGANVIAIGVEPNGVNINKQCGATDTSLLSAKVLEESADIGLALDGDADRLQVVDHKGEHIHGEQIIALMAKYWQSIGRLSCESVASTVTANMKLETYLSSLGIRLVRTKVGDRYVQHEMRKLGLNLGGEPSGHVLMSDYSGAGDGILTSLHLLACLYEEQARIGDLCPLFAPTPQMNLSFSIGDSNPLEEPEIQERIKQITNEIETIHAGRLIVRKSGTEPVIRAMIEIEDREIAQDYVQKVTEELTRHSP